MMPFDRRQANLTRTAVQTDRILSGRIWSELYFFLAVAKTGSFRKAAELIGESTATVSRRIKRLEEILKVELVISTTTGAHLTSAGRQLSARLAKFDVDISAITKNLAAADGSLKGMVSISATEGIAGVFLSQGLRELQRQHPDIQTHLKTSINVVDLRNNQSDMMISFMPEMAADLDHVYVGKMHFTTVASPIYLDEYGVPSIHDVESHLFVDTDFYHGVNGFWNDWQAIVARGTLMSVCESSLAYAVTVRSGLGIGLLATYVLQDKGYQQIDLGIHLEVPVYVTTLVDRLELPQVVAVREWLVKLISVSPIGNKSDPELTNVRPEAPAKAVNAMIPPNYG